MQKKSYFANTVESALALARREMGEDALLLAARPARPEERQWGAYEIEVAADNAPAAPPAAAAAPPAEVAGAGWKEELAGLRNEVSRLTLALAQHPQFGAPARWVRGEWARWHLRLRAAGVPPEIASEMIGQVEAAGDIGEPEAVLESYLQTLCAAPGSAARRQIFAGPPGSGKTTMLVKAAWRWALEERRSVALVSFDTHRIAAAEQLRSYAALLGVPCLVADTPWALEQCLAALPAQELVLIDTPGIGPRDLELLSLWAPAVTGGGADLHLVLNAATQTADQWSAVERFAPWEPKRIAFTRLDETSACGGMVATAIRSRLPISFLSCGQAVPEDLEPARAPRLLEWLTGLTASSTQTLAANPPQPSATRGAAA